MRKPRHAIYYSVAYGRNDGPPLYYFKVLKDHLGFDVMHLTPQGDTSKYGKFDYHWWIDWGEDGLPWTEWMPPKDGGKTIYVASDTHLDNGYRLEKARKFDYAFFNQKRAKEKYEGEWYGQQATWLPHAAEPLAYPHTVQAKKFDICFIGHLSDEPNVHGMSRVEMLDRAFSFRSNFYFGSRQPGRPEINMFNDAAKKYNQSRIVLNQSVRDDGLNMRFFEVLSAGSFLLTSRTEDAAEIGLIEREHYAAFASYDEMLKQIQYYLHYPKEREAIAKAGHKAFMQAHTYRHRVEKILETVGYPPIAYKNSPALT